MSDNVDNTAAAYLKLERERDQLKTRLAEAEAKLNAAEFKYKECMGQLEQEEKEHEECEAKLAQANAERDRHYQIAKEQCEESKRSKDEAKALQARNSTLELAQTACLGERDDYKAKLTEAEAANAVLRERLEELLQVCELIDDETQHQTRAIKKALAADSGKSFLEKMERYKKALQQVSKHATHAGHIATEALKESESTK